MSGAKLTFRYKGMAHWFMGMAHWSWAWPIGYGMAHWFMGMTNLYGQGPLYMLSDSLVLLTLIDCVETVWSMFFILVGVVLILQNDDGDDNIRFRP